MAKAETFPTNQSDPFGTVLGNTFRLIKKSWEALVLNLGTILLVYILPSLLIYALLYSISPDLLAGKADQVKLEDVNVPLAVAGGIGITILLTLLSIASIIAQLSSARGQKVSFGDVIEKSWPFFLRFIGLAVLLVLLVTAGLILFILPGILAIFFLTFSAYVMIDKNVGPVDAIKGSFQLTKRHWKIVLAYLVLMMAISLPRVVPVLGAFASGMLMIAYFCLPAILYLRMAKR